MYIYFFWQKTIFRGRLISVACEALWSTQVRAIQIRVRKQKYKEFPQNKFLNPKSTGKYITSDLI